MDQVRGIGLVSTSGMTATTQLLSSTPIEVIRYSVRLRKLWETFAFGASESFGED